MKELFIKTNSVKNWCSLSNWRFRLYPWKKMSFEHNSVRKNLFLSACFSWNSGLSLREMDQNLKFDGLMGYGISYLDSLFRYSKVFRLHAISHDAAGAVRSHTGKGPGYCYMIGRGPNCCLLGHVTGLLICLYVKVFLTSILNSVDFWRSMSCIVLDIELTEINVIKELGLLLMVLHKDFLFVHQRLVDLINRQHGTQNIYMELRGVVESWLIMSSLLSFTT